jgi:MoxR-like ATPase
VFHFIDFPDVEQMREIIAVHHPQVAKALLEQVLTKFYWLREQKELRKRPSTSELIDWITALLRAGVEPSHLEAEIPFMGALLKNEQDTRAIAAYLERGGKTPRELGELGGRRR